MQSHENQGHTVVCELAIPSWLCFVLFLRQNNWEPNFNTTEYPFHKLSLWTALSIWVYECRRLKIVHTFFVCCALSAPEQHQKCTRCGSRSLWNQAAPSSSLKFLAQLKATQFPPRAAEASHYNSSVRKMTSTYICACSIPPWQLPLIWLSSWMGLRKISAVLIFLLIVYERNFYCLAWTILVRTKDEWVYERIWNILLVLMMYNLYRYLYILYTHKLWFIIIVTL